MALARAAAGQVQLGDDDDREARRAAVIAEMDSRLATVGARSRGECSPESRGGACTAVVGRGVVFSVSAERFRPAN